MHIRKDDIVEVIAGDDKGKRGKIIQTVPEDGKVIVDGAHFAFADRAVITIREIKAPRASDLELSLHTGGRRSHLFGHNFGALSVALMPERALPADGVYAVRAQIGEQWLPAVANIGERPSFNTGERTIEVHVLDYKGDLYGRDLVIEFIQRLRPERRFADVSELIRQIRHDVRQARDIFAAEEEGKEHGESLS